MENEAVVKDEMNPTVEKMRKLYTAGVSVVKLAHLHTQPYGAADHSLEIELLDRVNKVFDAFSTEDLIAEFTSTLLLENYRVPDTIMGKYGDWDLETLFTHMGYCRQNAVAMGEVFSYGARRELGRIDQNASVGRTISSMSAATNRSVRG